MARRIIGAFLLALALLAILIMSLFVAVLPATTLVPPAVWIPLAAADLALFVAVVIYRRRPDVVAALVGGAILVALLAVAASQAFAGTAPILGDDGQSLPGSIAAMEKVSLNGSEQWITIRGKDATKPVLLYLGVGGPGAGGFPATRTTLAPLEDHFVVVNWDQPGTGKSYNAVPISDLTVQRFVEDARVLTEMLRTRFHQDKIYVVGLSWGTILGIKLVQQYPDLFYAYAGSGQMVNTTENDRFGYDLALKLAIERGDTRTADTLRSYGPPPYTGDGMALKYMAYNNVLFDYMGSLRLEGVLLLVPQFAYEYGWVDRLNFARGLIDSYPVVYSQLNDLDFTTQAAKLAVPVYFLVGKNDVNAVAALVERYYNVLQAPQKELVWLDSAHGAGAQEYLDVLVNHVLAQSPPTK
ncbi:MAG: alpha/beta hydrolase [Anaerolineae bacterium]